MFSTEIPKTKELRKVRHGHKIYQKNESKSNNERENISKSLIHGFKKALRLHKSHSVIIKGKKEKPQRGLTVLPL